MTAPIRTDTRPTGTADESAVTRPSGTQPAPPAGQGSRRSWHLRANAVVLVYVAFAVLTLVLHGWSSLSMPRWLALHLLLLGALTNAIVTWTEHFAIALLPDWQPSRGGAAARVVGCAPADLEVAVAVEALGEGQGGGGGWDEEVPVREVVGPE